MLTGKDITGMMLNDVFPGNFADEKALILESARQGFIEPLSFRC